jgi:predicted DNA-binding transcriptional regulator AlpA
MSRESDENYSDLLRLEEVSEITRLSPSTLRWLRHRGEGPPAFKLGRRLMFRRSAVLDWVRQEERRSSERTS